MEVASRPPLETLADLPVEEPSESAKLRAGPTPAAGAAPAAAAEAAKPKDPEQTGLNFVDPEMFLAPGQASTAVPVVSATEQSSKAPEPALELVLEDPMVDAMLTAPPAPAPPPVVAPPPASQVAPKPVSATDAAAARAAARIPIARTASLSAAATKLAAASGAPRPGKLTSARRPDAAAVPTAQPATKGEAVAKAAAPPSKATLTAAMTKSEASAPKLDAPSLASWASARAAAAPKVRPTPAPSAAGTASPPGASTSKSVASRSSSASPAPASSAMPAAQAPAAATPATSAPTAPSGSAVPPAPTMDRDFIARNQVVERYLSGRLPLKAATEFERFCRGHAELLDEIGLPERVNAGLRLLEASGKPEPWQEAPPPVWQRPQVTLGLAVAVAVLGMTLAGVAANSSSKSHRIAELQKQNSERALDPATSTREIRLLPSRSGASNSPAIVIGGGPSAQLADLKIDESRSAYRAFRVTIDRIDQGRVAVISNLEKDSNGHLRIALNSSALGPGNYQLTLEGLDWRGQPQPDSWVTIGIQR